MDRPLIELPPGLAKRWATAQARAAIAGAIGMIYHAIDGALVFAISHAGLVREFHDLDDFEIHLGHIESKA